MSAAIVMIAQQPLQHFRDTTFESEEGTMVQILLETPRGRTAAVSLPSRAVGDYDLLQYYLAHAARMRDLGDSHDLNYLDGNNTRSLQPSEDLLIIHQGRILEHNQLTSSTLLQQVEQQIDSRRQQRKEVENNEYLDTSIVVQLKCRGKGGMDRQNRVGSKFGGGGVSSAQQSERERKDRLKRLALESIDLAKDPYLMRNHLGTYECKLCLTLHTNEANYLAHTQGKKHQQGLARRAHMEKLKQEKEQQQQQQGGMPQHYQQQPKAKKIRIGRPAYQVFKSRDAETNQRCLSFELQYPEIDQELQPRHRFMSAFEQRVETPPDRRFQYLLIAAEPYDTVAFKIPNEPIDKGEDRFVTHWDAEDKKFTLTLCFVEQEQQQEQQNATNGIAGEGLAAVKTES
jgi:splicing factor 3A subunit 2